MGKIIDGNNVLGPREMVLEYPRNAEEPEKYPNPDDASLFKQWFEREGYILVRNAVPPALCEDAVQAFRHEVLPDRAGLFERHVSGKYEKHVVTTTGLMQYPIMNLQDIAGKKYPAFKKNGLDLLTQATVQRVISILFGEPGRMVHTMYFDGNQNTWAHRDGSYIDSQEDGKMIGVWIAAEDIHPDAGRFYIVPRSHRMPVPGEEGDPNSDAHKVTMAAFVRNGPLDCVAPVLKQGDMLLWTSRTIHGSLPTVDKRYARRSFTAHYVPQSHAFKWNVRTQASRRTLSVNGVEVILHQDDSDWVKRVRNHMRSAYPRFYDTLRKLLHPVPA